MKNAYWSVQPPMGAASLFFFAILLAVAPVAPSVWGQAGTTGNSTEGQPSDAEPSRSDQLYAQFAKSAADLRIQTAEERPFELDETPLFRFSSEGKVFGSVYVWKDADKRLAVIGTVGSIPIQQSDYEFIELHLLKDKPITPLQIIGRPSKVWSPDVSQLSMRPLPDAPPVAKSPTSRLVQMKALSRRFASSMRSDGQNNQLRLLPAPLFRYSDSKETHDGALFAFVWDKGTDPELLLRIETIEVDGEPLWHYQPVRFTWRELELKHQDEQVWAVDEFVRRDAVQQLTPYITGLTKVIPLEVDSTEE